MKLTDIQPLEKWVELENSIHRQFKISANAFDINGIRISTVMNWANRLCPKIKSIDKGQSFICAVAHMNIAAQARHQNHTVIEECDAGLLKMVVPLIIDDTFVGSFSACGMLLEDGEVDTFLIEKTTGIPEAEALDLSSDVKTINQDTLAQLADLIRRRLDEMIRRWRDTSK